MIQTGDIVRLTPEAYRRVQLAIDDVCGEVIKTTRLAARVAWDDGRETSVLLSNLEIADKPLLPSTYDEAYISRLLEERVLLVAEAWARP